MTGLQALDMSMPEFSENETTEEKLDETRSYLMQMMEALRYLMNNLDSENFNETGLKEITEPITAEIEDVAGNVTTLQVTAEGLQSQVTAADGKASSAQQTADKLQTQVTSVDGKASTALQTANGVQVEVNGLKSRNTVTIDSTGLYVTDVAGNTTKLSGNHITSGTIEGVTLISKSGDSAITITDGAIKLQYGSGSTIISQGVSGASISSDSFFGGGLSIKMNSVNLSGSVNLIGSLSAGDTNVGGDLTVAQNINSNGIMKLNAGGNASFDAGGTLYLQTNGGNVNIGNGGTINLNGTVLVNGSPLTAGGST